METIMIPIILITICFTAFYAGKIHERMAWNKLIDEGKLPKPGSVIGGVSNCLIKGKPDSTGPLFTCTRYATIAHLNGYAIVPREEYEEMARLAKSEQPQERHP